MPIRLPLPCLLASVLSASMDTHERHWSTIHAKLQVASHSSSMPKIPVDPMPAPSFVQSSSAEATQVVSLDTEVGACAICLDKLCEDVDDLPCGHRFHRNCTAHLLARAIPKCPLCRSPYLATLITDHIKTLLEGSQEAQVHAAAVLRSLARNSATSRLISEKGGVQALITVLREGSHDEAQAYAASALGSLAWKNSDSEMIIRHEGGIRALIRVVREGNHEAQGHAASALGLLALKPDLNSEDHNQMMIRDEGGIQALITVLREGSQEAQARAADALESLAQNSQSAVMISEKGGIEALIMLLEGSHKARTSAARALVGLAKNSQNKELMIRQEGGIQASIMVLREGSHDAQAQCHNASALWLLALRPDQKSESHTQVMIREEGGIQALITVLRARSYEAQSSAEQALVGPTRNNQNEESMIREAGIRGLITVLREGSQDAQACAADVLESLAQNSQNMDLIREQGGIQALFKILHEGSHEAQSSAARTLAGLASKSQNEEVILEQGCTEDLIKIDGFSPGAIWFRRAKVCIRHVLWKLQQMLQLPFTYWRNVKEPEAEHELAQEPDLQALEQGSEPDPVLNQTPASASKDTQIQIAELHEHPLNLVIFVLTTIGSTSACIAFVIFCRQGRLMPREFVQPLLIP